MMTHRPTNQQGIAYLKILPIIIILITIGIGFYLHKKNHKDIETISREGVVTQIQQLNRLQTVAFSVDTVITSQKAGNWYALWQDEQKGLFIAQGRVTAGIDLSKLTPEMVQITKNTNPQTNTQQNHIIITLPPSEIFDVYLDNIEVYDWKTGIFGMIQADPDILKQAQQAGKKEVLNKACQGNVLQMAIDNAQVQVQKLFALTGTTVQVETQGTGGCFTS